MKGRADGGNPLEACVHVGCGRLCTQADGEATPLDDVDLGRQIARDFKANGLLAHLRCVPDSHIVSSFRTGTSCADPYWTDGDPRPKAPITFAFDFSDKPGVGRRFFNLSSFRT
jgi:hypothetical protein